jgi:hypothetical protein
VKRRFFRTWKRTLLHLARATLTQFRACYPEKAIFSNQIEVTISAGNVIFPNLKLGSFLKLQNNLDSITSDLATWKSFFTERERNCFISWKGDFS